MVKWWFAMKLRNSEWCLLKVHASGRMRCLLVSDVISYQSSRRELCEAEQHNWGSAPTVTNHTRSLIFGGGPATGLLCTFFCFFQLLELANRVTCSEFCAKNSTKYGSLQTNESIMALFMLTKGHPNISNAKFLFTPILTWRIDGEKKNTTHWFIVPF